MESFLQENDSWLTSYACFQVLKGREEGKPWWKWSDDSKNADSRIGDEMSDEPEFTFHVFLQYLLGAMEESAFYANGKTFPLGTFHLCGARFFRRSGKGRIFFRLPRTPLFPTWAGVPPDYFNENGQYWGNLFMTGSATKRRAFPGGWIDWRFSSSFST